MRFKIDWAILIVGGKFTVFALFFFAFVVNFPNTSPRGVLYWEGRFNGRFFALPVWGTYIWRGLYMEGLIHGQCCQLSQAIRETPDFGPYLPVQIRV